MNDIVQRTICTMTVSQKRRQNRECTTGLWITALYGISRFRGRTPISQKWLKIALSIITQNSPQSTGESNKSGLEALQGRITKLAFYGENKG